MAVGRVNWCNARRYSDCMRCERCNLIWDVNDTDPPQCLTGRELFLRQKAQLNGRTTTEREHNRRDKKGKE